MTPPGLSVEPPSIIIVQTILSHAELPLDTIALAACILDTLPARFHSRWRMSYPRSRQPPPTSKRHPFPAGLYQPPSNDVVYPEVVILAALILAFKFVEDKQDSTQYFSLVWGRQLWSCDQINVTEQCIMEAIGYHILPLWSVEYIKQARHDIELARRELLDENREPKESEEYELCNSKPMSSGKAVVGFGLQLTPAETPKSELYNSYDHIQSLDQETREAFGNQESVPHDYLHLPAEGLLR